MPSVEIASYKPTLSLLIRISQSGLPVGQPGVRWRGLHPWKLCTRIFVL